MPLAYDIFVKLFNHADKIGIVQGGIGSEMKLSYDKTYVHTYLPVSISPFKNTCSNRKIYRPDDSRQHGKAAGTQGEGESLLTAVRTLQMIPIH